MPTTGQTVSMPSRGEPGEMTGPAGRFLWERTVESIRIIHDEHRSLAAVLHGMLYLVRETRLHGASPNFDVLDAMVYYIDTFTERFHHPKEDVYLFRFLQARYPNAASLVEQLETEHRAGVEKIRTLEQALKRYRQGGPEDRFFQSLRGGNFFHWQRRDHRSDNADHANSGKN
jgi:hemerythrin-like domain-containing protein